MLPQTIQHYKSMLPNSTITICDNESTDDSVAKAKELGCKIYTWSSNKADIFKKREVSNTCWKKVAHVSKGWVIVCDMDEWLCVTEKDLEQEEAKGTTILTVDGYNITAKSKEVNLEDLDMHRLNEGYFNQFESKYLCFRVPEIQEINYNLGAHDAKPVGLVKYSAKHYINKHMNDLGLPFLIDKMKKRFARTKKNRKRGHSTHYTNDIKLIKKRFRANLKKSEKLRCSKGYCFSRKRK